VESPALLAACGDDEEETPQPRAEPAVDTRPPADGESVWFVRTDASDETFARREKLVFAPRIASLSRDGLSGELVVVEDGPAVLSSRPGKDDYTPAWRVRRGRWSGTPRELSSLGDVRAAERAGDLELEDAGAVMNAAVVKWPGGQLAVDRKLRKYLEGGQLIETPDTRSGEVKFKLHECFPNARYIVTDHSITVRPGGGQRDGRDAVSDAAADRRLREAAKLRQRALHLSAQPRATRISQACRHGLSPALRRHLPAVNLQTRDGRWPARLTAARAGEDLRLSEPQAHAAVHDPDADAATLPLGTRTQARGLEPKNCSTVTCAGWGVRAAGSVPGPSVATTRTPSSRAASTALETVRGRR
jgi:hypothetical protein